MEEKQDSLSLIFPDDDLIEIGLESASSFDALSRLTIRVPRIS